MAAPILGKKDLAKAEALRERLSEDYRPFFRNMADFYRRNSLKTEEAGLVERTIPKIERSLVLIARIFMGRGVTAPTQKELDQLNQFLSDIEEAKNIVVQKATEHELAKSALEEAVVLSGISPEELSLSVKLAKPSLIKRLIGGDKRGGLLKGAIGAGLLSQILAPLLGPLYLPVMGVLAGAGYGTFKGIQGIKGWLGKGQKMLKGLGGTGRGGLGGGSGMPAVETVPQMQPQVPFGTPSRLTAQPQASRMEWLRDNQGRFIGGKGDIKAIQQAAMPIWFFFDKLAYRAKWTKEVLGALKGRQGGGGRGAGISSLELAALGAAIAFASYEIMKLAGTIGEYFGVKKVVGAEVEKQVKGREKFQDRIVQAKLQQIKGMDVSEEEKRRMKVGVFKEEGAEWAKGSEEVHQAKTTWVGRRWEEFEGGVKALAPGGVQPMQTATTTPITAPEIVMPPAGRLTENLEQNQNILDGLEGIKNEVKESGKRPSISPSVTGPYDSLADPLLKGLNSSGADFLPEYLNR